jgi:hypothetical protein
MNQELKILHVSRPARRRRRRYLGEAGVWRAKIAAGRVLTREREK